jgi:hypothetical protein
MLKPARAMPTVPNTEQVGAAAAPNTEHHEAPHCEPSSVALRGER